MRFTKIEVAVIVVIVFILWATGYSAVINSRERKDFVALCVADGVKEYECKERSQAFRLTGRRY